MLKHHARQFTRRLIILLLLLTAFAAALSSPVERSAQANELVCYQDFSPESGSCIVSCCGPGYCYWYPCQ
jgi:hypothetical protein